MNYSKKLLLIMLALCMAATSAAIPAFARKYNISCMVCHSPSVPKLKPYGDTYAGDGFKLADYEAPRFFAETGDQKLSLIRNFPIAVRMDGYVQAIFDNEGGTDLSSPYLIKLLSGGQVSEHLAYYFYFYMDEHGEVAGVEDAYLMYDNLLNTGLDIILGQFQVSDPLFKRELRLTFEDYDLYTSKIGLSRISMKYEKGIMLTYSLPTATDLVFEVVNGNGLAEAGNRKFFDNDRHKSVLGRVSQDIGDHVRLGAVAYYGKEDLVNSDAIVRSEITNEALFLGSDATITLDDKLEFNLQYLFRQDSRVYANRFSNSPLTDVFTHALLGEVIFSPQGDESDWYAVALYNYVESGYNPADYHSATLHMGYLLRRNVRLGLEYTQVFTDPDDPYGRLSLGFTSAF